MARSYRQVTICAKLFTIAVWMDMRNFHLPLGSLRGWLLATGEGRWKSTAKSGSASKWCGIWMHYLKACGGAACSGAPGRRSRLIDLDELGSCSCFMAEPRFTKVYCSASNNVCCTSNEAAVWSAAVGEATGRQSLSSPIICPLMPKVSSSRHSILCSC